MYPFKINQTQIFLSKNSLIFFFNDEVIIRTGPEEYNVQVKRDPEQFVDTLRSVINYFLK